MATEMTEETPQSATTATQPPKKIQRVRIGLNVLVQIALVLFLAAMVNYLGFEHYKRWDLSRDKKYELSDKSKRFLDTIKGKVRMTVFFGGNNPIATDVQNLLTQYQYASKGKVDVENIDPERSLSRAKELFEKYKVVSDESLVIVDYDGRSKTVKASEMADMDPGNPMFGEGPKVTAFKGEQAITSAMIDLVEGKKNEVGYLLGHGEPPLVDAPPTMQMPMQPQPGARSPVSVMKMLFENENIALKELNLFDVPSIPAEIKTIMILGPQYDLSDREMQLLREFWDKQGRILLLLDPAAKTPKLHAFIKELGVTVNDDRLMANVRTGIQEVARVRDVVGRFLPDSPITKRLGDVQAPFLGGTASLTLASGDQMRNANIRLQPLVQAEKGYWGEADYNSTDDDLLQFTEGRDQDAPLQFATSIEKGGSTDDRVQANSSRMVVVANSGFIHDNALTQYQQALDFVSGSVNWLLSREQLIGIAPKIPQTLTFSLDEIALRNLRWLVLVLMPLVPAVLGVAVWWQRRA
ncbi:MAG TPA: GldG family protein [Chthoniobacterales bacterium]|nr:GldG family protein [Chthoniobacterales bacterium]